MAIGALAVIFHVRRVSDDQVEFALHTGQHVTVVHADVIQRGQLGIHRGHAQGTGVDIHRQHLGVMPGFSNHQRTDAGATANVYSALERLETLLQIGFDHVGKAVAVGAEKHRVRLVGGIRRMGEQQPVEARPTHCAAP